MLCGDQADLELTEMCLLGAGIKRVHHHTRHGLGFLRQDLILAQSITDIFRDSIYNFSFGNIVLSS